MTTEVIVAIISSIASVVAVVITSISSNAKVQKQIEISQAVMQEKIANLADEVRTHNEFARRMPVIEEQIKHLSNRVSDLESNARGGKR